MVEITDQVALQECVGDKGRVLQRMKVGESFAVRAGRKRCKMDGVESIS